MVRAIKTAILFMLVFSSGPAYAAEALLPVTATIIRCVTQSERVNMCDLREMCCNLVSPENMTLSKAQGDWNEMSKEPEGTENKFADIIIE